MNPLPCGVVCQRVVIENDAQTLSVYWSDGRHCTYPLDGLRRACPCASCQGHEKMHELPDPEIFRVPSLMRWEKVKAEVAGSVGLRLHWDDGHNSGIFTWERLRAMCPCEPSC